METDAKQLTFVDYLKMLFDQNISMLSDNDSGLWKSLSEWRLTLQDGAISQ